MTQPLTSLLPISSSSSEPANSATSLIAAITLTGPYLLSKSTCWRMIRLVTELATASTLPPRSSVTLSSACTDFTIAKNFVLIAGLAKIFSSAPANGAMDFNNAGGNDFPCSALSIAWANFTSTFPPNARDTAAAPALAFGSCAGAADVGCTCAVGLAILLNSNIFILVPSSTLTNYINFLVFNSLAHISSIMNCSPKWF